MEALNSECSAECTFNRKVKGSFTEELINLCWTLNDFPKWSEEERAVNKRTSKAKALK